MVQSKDEHAPDYDYWWNKPDLTKEELIWVMNERNPESAKYERILEEKSELTREEEQWLSNLGHDFRVFRLSLNNSSIESLCFYHFSDFWHWSPECKTESLLFEANKSLKDVLDSVEAKKAFIKTSYENLRGIFSKILLIDSFLGQLPFIQYLIQNNLFEIDEELEKYKDKKSYRLNFDTVNLDEIKTSESTFAVFLGLEPKHFQRFSKMENARIKGRITEQPSPHDIWFYQSYDHFFTEEYRHIELNKKQPIDFYTKKITGKTLVKTFNEIIKKHSQRLFPENEQLLHENSDFKFFAQAFYDIGLIFRPQVYKWLKDTHEIQLHYSPDAWLIRFYERWTKEHIWSAEQASYLLKGQNPDGSDEDHQFKDFSQHPAIIKPMQDPKFFEPFEGKYVSMNERLAKYVATKSIESFYIQGEFYYRAKDIIKWMLDNIPYNPPEALIQVLFRDDPEKQEIYEQGKEKRVEESQIASLEIVEAGNTHNNRRKELERLKEKMQQAGIKDGEYSQDDMAIFLEKKSLHFNIDAETIKHCIKQNKIFRFPVGRQPNKKKQGKIPLEKRINWDE